MGTSKITLILASLATAAALALSGCVSPSGVEAGDGPDPNQATSETYDDPSESVSDETEGMDEESAPAEQPAVANFQQKYTYPDGVQVEVIKIKRGLISKAQAEYSEPEAKSGEPWVHFTVRVENGSKTNLDAYNDWIVTYGPDGEQAISPYLSDMTDKDLSGKILPGRSKTVSKTFVIPTKHQGDPVLEFSFDGEHEAAIFTGPVGK